MTQDQGQSPKTICVGKIAGAHGVKGLAKIQPYCEDISLLEQVIDFEITIKNSNGKHMLVDIKDIHASKILGREDIEQLKGTKLYVPREALAEIGDDDTYYFEDLVGLAVVDTSGDEIGKVKAVEDYGAGELLDIRLKNGREFLLPFTEAYVPVVGEQITIQDYEAFLE